jgi:hypothetical protein
MEKQQAAMILQGFRGGQPLVITAHSWPCGTLRPLPTSSKKPVSAITPCLSPSPPWKQRGCWYEQVGQHGKFVYMPVGDSFFGYFAQDQKILKSQNPVFPDSGLLLLLL